MDGWMDLSGLVVAKTRKQRSRGRRRVVVVWPYPMSVSLLCGPNSTWHRRDVFPQANSMVSVRGKRTQNDHDERSTILNQIGVWRGSICVVVMVASSAASPRRNTMETEPPLGDLLKRLRRLILEVKRVPCHSGSDDPRPDLDKCPIYCLVSPLHRKRFHQNHKGSQHTRTHAKYDKVMLRAYLNTP